MLAILLLAFSAATAATSDEPDEAVTSLSKVKRVYVAELAGGETAPQIRDMLISALQNSKLFLVTENEERADAILRGSADDNVFTDEHSTSDSINTNFHASSGGGTRSASYKSTGGGVGENESSHVSERKHEAVAAVRLVNKDGDVIWSTTQESFGAKFRGSSADVADKVMKRLSDDIAKARCEPRKRLIPRE